MTWKLNKTLLLAVTSAIGSLYQLLIPATSGGGWGRRQAKEKASCKVMVAGEGRVAMQEDVEGKDHLVPPAGAWEVGDSTVPPSIHLSPATRINGEGMYAHTHKQLCHAWKDDLISCMWWSWGGSFVLRIWAGKGMYLTILHFIC